jgi:phenylpropionate dioxygenase-like ring-hydroxylating dioxygenase large terminal subunit
MDAMTQGGSMFGPTSQVDSANSRYPAGSGIREPDWHILAGFWHPVAFAHEVADRPVGARLLDVPLVVYRTGSGIAVARDRCPHRGARLSQGRVSDDRLICPMHGLHFAGDGRCTRIPSIADPSFPIPPKFRLSACRTTLRYGIVWACLKDEPIWPLPEWEGIGDPALKPVFVPPFTWRASAGRHVENFNDLAHFPWVHGGSFGHSDIAPVPPYEVRRTSYGLAFDYPYTEGVNRFPDAAGAGRATRDVVYGYELTFPFATLIKVAPVGSDYVHYFGDAVCPVSAGESRIFQVCTDTTGDPDPAYWIKDSLAIVEEDAPLVEAQEPAALPLDLRQEIHIPADRLSIAYRRALVETFGLGR